MWGSAKVGKTTYACSSPGRKYIINLDPEGYVSIEYRDDVTIWDFSDREPRDLVPYLMDKLGTQIEKSGAQPGDTFIFDSVTMLNQHALTEAVRRNVGAGKKGFNPTIEEPGQSAYGARTQFLIHTMHPILRATRRIGCHVWFIAHENTPERDDKGNFLYQSILMSDNAINQTSAAISEVWRMTVGTSNNRELFVRQTGSYKPMGSRIFRMDEAAQFKLAYDIDKPDAGQPHAISSLWAKYLEGGKQKLHVPK